MEIALRRNDEETPVKQRGIIVLVAGELREGLRRNDNGTARERRRNSWK